MQTWTEFFTAKGLTFLDQSIDLALAEDGRELTAEGLFAKDARLSARIRAKEETLVAGLPLAGLVLKKMNVPFSFKAYVREGALVKAMTDVATLTAPASGLLKAERIILNYICHLSGIANLTARYVRALEGTGVRLLDTRKTSPGLRWPEKYAVQVGGGTNHRMDLESMLMLKDNHIDAVGSITTACATLRKAYAVCPPIEVECRTLEQVKEAVAAKVSRIMLDNMSLALLARALPLIPEDIESEISGGVSLETIRAAALASERRPDFISVGRITHSAAAADFSMTLESC